MSNLTNPEIKAEPLSFLCDEWTAKERSHYPQTAEVLDSGLSRLSNNRPTENITPHTMHVLQMRPVSILKTDWHATHRSVRCNRVPQVYEEQPPR